MAGDDRGRLRRFVGRTAFILVCWVAPFVGVAHSWVAGGARPRPNVAAIVLAVFGLWIASVNAWLTFVRPLLYRWRHGSMEGLANVSIVPGIGTLFVFVSLLVAPGGDRAAAIISAIALLLDTGGLPWFLFCVWGDRSFWDAGRPGPGG